MALTQADLLALAKSEKAEEDKIIGLLVQISTDQKAQKAALDAALAAVDPVAMQAVADQMSVNIANVDAAIAAVTPAQAGTVANTGTVGSTSPLSPADESRRQTLLSNPSRTPDEDAELAGLQARTGA